MPLSDAESPASTPAPGGEPELPLAGGAPREPYHPKPPTPLPDEPAKRGMSELARRLLTAAVLIPLVLYIVAIGGIVYLLTVMAFVAIGQREFYRLIEDKGAMPLDVLGLAFGAALCVVAFVGNEYHATILLTGSLLGLMVAQLRKAQIQESLASISGTFFGVFYVAWLLSHAIVLRNFFAAANAKYAFDELLLMGLHPNSGAFFMVFVLTVVVACDAGAYFAGRAYGRRKLAPAPSAPSRRSRARSAGSSPVRSRAPR